MRLKFGNQGYYGLFLKYIHPDDRNYVDNAIKETLNGNLFDIEYRIIKDNGEERIVHARGDAIFGEDNTPFRLFGTVQDITERKKADEKIRESEEKYRNIVEIASEGIVIVDSNNKIIYINNKIVEMLGYNRDEIIGKSALDFSDEEGKIAIKFNRDKINPQRIENTYEFKFIRKDGSSLLALSNSKILFDKEGNFTGTLSMITDITEKKKAEQVVKYLEEARKKEIHHRIKNNLQVISSLLDLQADKIKHKKNVSKSEFMEAFKESQDRVISIALIHEQLHKSEDTDTLNFSSYIEELADNLFLTYRLGNENIRFRKDIEDNIYFDIDVSIPLGLILNELISNSSKYAFPNRDNGEIQIKLQRENGEDIKEDCTVYVMSVSDNGVGIPEDLDIENLDSLGLQLVTTLVEQLDGNLEVKRDNGTEFIINFSAAKN